jgi:hypothetical protein
MEELIKKYTVETKQRLRGLQDVKAAFADVREQVARDVDGIRNRAATSGSAVPEITYQQIADGTVSASTIDDIRRAGAAIIRGVFPRTQAEEWNEQLGEYIAENDYQTKAKEKAGLDKYFSGLDAGAPQIFGLYWSKPQMMARQAESMAQTKQFLNRLWQIDGPMGAEFDPDQDYTYADRTRRRRPGDTTLGLSPHMDSGSYERWLDPAYQRIYGPIFEGAWREYDPWRATYRTQTREYASTAVCSMFRTFQGWTALTAQGPEDGTLSLIPSAQGIAYFLLRALQEDVADDDLCGAAPGRALSADPAWHGEILEGLTSIPLVEPGDTVWWHPDIIHSVADAHTGDDYANVIYIGVSPKCQKNAAYASRQVAKFFAGESAPDFAPEDYEVDFNGRATLDDLTELGKKQMGL